jgi:hypothetical protein
MGVGRAEFKNAWQEYDIQHTEANVSKYRNEFHNYVRMDCWKGIDTSNKGRRSQGMTQ